jgi:hypothetical protein
VLFGEGRGGTNIRATVWPFMFGCPSLPILRATDPSRCLIHGTA